MDAGTEPDLSRSVSEAVGVSTVFPAQSRRVGSLPSGVPADFAAFVRSEAFPCVGAKSALALDRLVVMEAGEIGSDEHDEVIHRALVDFALLAAREDAGIGSFACLFRHQKPMSEEQFEAALWSRIQALHDLDTKHGIAWAPNVSSDASSPHFSMSIGGAAYFLVGLHPGASRAARRFCRPAIIFNPHDQFERLRADGRYDMIQRINRDREMRQHGSINPMLSDFGRGQEAAQYSGRHVGADWCCPLQVHPKKDSQ